MVVVYQVLTQHYSVKVMDIINYKPLSGVHSKMRVQPNGACLPFY